MDNKLSQLIHRLALMEDDGGITAEVQSMVDGNQWLRGSTVATDDLVDSSKFVLYFSQDAAKHIQERHSAVTKPGSLFAPSVNLRDVAGELLNTAPTEQGGGRVKWLGADAGVTVGSMGVAYADPAQVGKMTDYQMPDGQKETVKVTQGQRQPTSEVSLITSELGKLSDGRTVLSLITMFPGGTTVDGKSIPMNRSEFTDQGFYFVVSGSADLGAVTEHSLANLIKIMDFRQLL